MKIKPCPFCGAEIDVVLEIDAYHVSHPFVQGCVVSGLRMVYESDCYSISEVESEWNRRAEEGGEK